MSISCKVSRYIVESWIVNNDDDDDDDDFIISVVFNKKIRALLGMFRDQDYRQFHVGEYSR